MNRSIRWALLVIVSAWIPSLASADKVAVLPIAGEATQERRDAIEDAVMSAARGAGHEALFSPIGAGNVRPSTSSEFLSTAQAQSAAYVVSAEVPIVFPAQYRLRLVVFTVASRRIEEFDANIPFEEEASRLLTILTAMLRPDGLGEDAATLLAPSEPTEPTEPTVPPNVPPAATTPAPTPIQTTNEAPAAETPFERYGEAESPVWLVQLGAFAESALFRDPRSKGTPWLGGIQARVGRTFTAVPGLEARAGLDLYWGGANAMALTVGAAYFFSPFDYPVFIGPEAALGWQQFLSGSRDAAFVFKAGAVATWRATGQLYVEASLPIFEASSAGTGLLSMGLAARVGYRF